MAKRAKPEVKRGRSISNFPKVPAGELLTLLDFVRYAVSRFVEAKLVFAHGTTDPVAEAAFLVCETLHLHPNQFETFATARVTAREAKAILEVIARRVTTRKPAAYLVNKIYMRGLPFYVDERVIVPRSFIGELLDSHLSGQGDDDGGSLIDDPASVENVLDLCTGSGCLAVLASRSFPNAMIDAVEVSQDGPDGAARNIADYGLEDRVTLHRGDLFQPLGSKRYDLIICNPPYADAEGMVQLPHDYPPDPHTPPDAGRAEPGPRWRRRRTRSRPPCPGRDRAASDAAGRTIVRNRPRPRAVRGRVPATTAAMARHPGTPRRGGQG